MQGIFMFQMLLFSLLLLISLPLSAKELVLVSVAPYKLMVEELTNKEVDVQLLVPVGYSLHTYEPTPKQIIQAVKAKLWFIVGEQFEKKVVASFSQENPQLQIVDLRQNLSLLSDHCHDENHQHHHHADETDPHLWMSPKMMQVQVATMARALSKTFPGLTQTIEVNEQKLQMRLQALDIEITTILKEAKNRPILVSHPAYGYFCREYQLKQESIEFEGKDPTPKQLNSLLLMAKTNHITTIFTQAQYSTKASNLVAQEIGAKVVLLDPYSADYFASLLFIAHSFAEATQ